MEQEAFNLVAPQKRIIVAIFVLLPAVHELLSSQLLNPVLIFLQLLAVEQARVFSHAQEVSRKADKTNEQRKARYKRK